MDELHGDLRRNTKTLYFFEYFDFPTFPTFLNTVIENLCRDPKHLACESARLLESWEVQTWVG